MKREVLLFGVDQLPVILAAAGAARAHGAELRVVPPRDWGLPLDRIADGQAAPEGETAPVLTGRMAVLCGLEDRVQSLAPALTQAGVICPKAVLTETNRHWTPERLLRELDRERAALQNRKK
jgi:hypothetical protein